MAVNASPGTLNSEQTIASFPVGVQSVAISTQAVPTRSTHLITTTIVHSTWICEYENIGQIIKLVWCINFFSVESIHAVVTDFIINTWFKINSKKVNIKIVYF